MTLDVNAAGNLWFVDATPMDDAEFLVAGVSDPGTGFPEPGYSTRLTNPPTARRSQPR